MQIVKKMVSEGCFFFFVFLCIPVLTICLFMQGPWWENSQSNLIIGEF